jgi:NarL family two-component system response regulator LiaR
MDPITALIVDDHQVVRQGLRVFLESEGDITVVGEAGNGLDAVSKAQELLPDIILMDLVMPGMDGIAAIRKIRETTPSCKVIVLTSFSDAEKVFPAIKAGAAGYLLKDIPAEELGNAIRAVAFGGFLLHPAIAGKVLEEFSEPKSAAPALTMLTLRERNVLTLLAKHRTNKEIAQELNISVKTVKTHVSNILSKLHMMDRAQAAVYALQQGLVPPDAPGPKTRS